MDDIKKRLEEHVEHLRCEVEIVKKELQDAKERARLEAALKQAKDNLQNFLNSLRATSLIVPHNGHNHMVVHTHQDGFNHGLDALVAQTCENLELRSFQDVRVLFCSREDSGDLRVTIFFPKPPNLVITNHPSWLKSTFYMDGEGWIVASGLAKDDIPLPQASTT